MLTAKSAILAILLCASPAAAFAQSTPMGGDAMAPSPTATDAMAPMSEEDLAKCLEQSAMVTFTPAMQAATDACHAMHNDAMGTDAMGGDAMSGGAMAPSAPAQ